MKKITYSSYGPPEVLKLTEAPVPEPAKDEVLVKIYAAGVNPVDYKLRNGSMKLIAPGKFPRTPGGEVAGVVEKTGTATGRFKPGDRVFAMLSLRGGGYSQYLNIKENLLSLMPEKIDFTDAAVIPLAGLTALQSLRDKGGIQSGMQVLVNGASGGVGIYALQIARIYDAEITAVCSGKNAEFVENFGAHHTINYQSDDFTKQSKQYDIVFDAVAKSSFGECKAVLKKEGSYITTIPAPGVMLRQIINPLTSKKAFGIMCTPGQKDLNLLAMWAKEGLLKTSVEKVFELEDAHLAHKYIETGRVKGKIAINIPH